MSEVPKAAAALQRLAERHGWSVEITHANSEDTTSVAVRMRREASLIAMWVNGKFWTGVLGNPATRFNLTETRAYVSTPRPAVIR